MKEQLQGWLRLSISALGFCTVACVHSAKKGDPLFGEPTTNRFHVLFIAVDDLRPELGCYGAEYVQTPHIDSLAQGGVTFLSHFSAVPTCGASRSAFSCDGILVHFLRLSKPVGLLWIRSL